MIIVVLEAASNRGSHSDENLFMSGLLNSLHSIATTKQYGEERELVLYIPCLSFFNGSSFVDQLLVHSTKSSFSLANFSLSYLL